MQLKKDKTLVIKTIPVTVLLYKHMQTVKYTSEGFAPLSSRPILLDFCSDKQSFVHLKAI